MENKLQVIVNESGLETTKAKVMIERFSDYFQIADEWEKKARAIVVTNESQVADMQMARVGRLFLRDKRIALEKTRKELKEQSLREGKAIDGIANILKSIIVPIEDHLENQEKYIENKEKARLEAEAIETARKEEAARIAAEIAEAAERERIKAENERLRKEAEEKERMIAEERKKAQAEIERVEREKREAERKARAEKEEAERAARLAMEEKEREIRAEKEKAEKARMALENKIRAEKEEAARIEAENKQRIEAAAMASDYEKLDGFATALSRIVYPVVSSEKANRLLKRVESEIASIIRMINRSNKE